MRDDPAQKTPSWSFLLDRRTDWPVNGNNWLLDRLNTEPGLQQSFIRSHTGPAEWNLKGINRYFQSLKLFRGKLSVLVHVTAGQPARAPGLLSIRHKNTVDVHRNIFCRG